MNEFYPEEIIDVNCEKFKKRDAPHKKSYKFKNISKASHFNLKRDINQCIEGDCFWRILKEVTLQDEFIFKIKDDTTSV